MSNIVRKHYILGCVAVLFFMQACGMELISVDDNVHLKTLKSICFENDQSYFMQTLRNERQDYKTMRLKFLSLWGYESESVCVNGEYLEKIISFENHKKAFQGIIESLSKSSQIINLIQKYDGVSQQDVVSYYSSVTKMRVRVFEYTTPLQVAMESKNQKAEGFLLKVSEGKALESFVNNGFTYSGLARLKAEDYSNLCNLVIDGDTGNVIANLSVAIGALQYIFKIKCDVKIILIEEIVYTKIQAQKSESQKREVIAPNGYSSLLHYAIAVEDISMILELCQHDKIEEMINVRNVDGQTPLDILYETKKSMEKYSEIYTVLISKGAMHNPEKVELMNNSDVVLYNELRAPHFYEYKWKLMNSNAGNNKGQSKQPDKDIDKTEKIDELSWSWQQKWCAVVVTVGCLGLLYMALKKGLFTRFA